MFRKLLEFFGFSKQPEVDLPCEPCTEGCKSGDDCFKTDVPVSVVPAELVEPAIVEQFYRQDTPPTPTPVEPAANALAPAAIPVPSTKKKVKAPAVKKEKKEVAKKAATPAITAPKKKKTPAKKK